jgi:hypothetical protein
MATKFDRRVPFQTKGTGFGQVVVVILAALLADFERVQLLGNGVVYELCTVFVRWMDLTIQRQQKEKVLVVTYF